MEFVTPTNVLAQFQKSNMHLNCIRTRNLMGLQ